MMVLRYIVGAFTISIASMATAKPPMPDYSSNSASSQSMSGIEAGKEALGFAAEQAVEKVAEAEVPKIAQAATTTAVFDGTSDAAKALDYGRYAGAAARGVFATKQVYDLSKLYYGLGGAAADIKALGLEEGSIAASERLSKIDIAKPLVAVGNYLGERVAAGVQKYEQNHNKALNPKKTSAAKSQAVEISEKKTEERKICFCTSPDVFFAGVCKKKLPINDHLWAQYYCKSCGGFRRGRMLELMNTDNGVVVYPAGSVPSDWDGKIYEQSELDDYVMGLIDNATGKAPKTNAEEGNVVNSHQTNTDVDGEASTNFDSQIGVRGWCHCWDKVSPPIGGLVKGGIGSVGDDNLFGDKAEFKSYGIIQTYDGDYSYTLCARCGRCFTTKKPGEKYSDLGHDIIDAKTYHKWHKKAGSEMPQYQYDKLLGKARDRILKIPDGGIVIPGVCHCEHPDPVSVNIFGDVFYVCCFCGKVRLPDETGNIPTGPTQWRILMGEDKPFPGFANAKENK